MITPRVPERVGQPGKGGGEVRAPGLGYVDGAAVALQGRVKIVQPFPGPGQGIMSFEEIRFQARRFLINVPRLVHQAGAFQDTAEIVIRQGEIGTSQHRPAQGLQRVVEPVQTIEHKTQFHPGVGISGTQPNGLAVGRERALGVALALQFTAEMKMIIGETVIRCRRRPSRPRPLFFAALPDGGVPCGSWRPVDIRIGSLGQSLGAAFPPVTCFEIFEIFRARTREAAF